MEQLGQMQWRYSNPTRRIRRKTELMGIAYYAYERPADLVFPPYVQELCLTDRPFRCARIKKTSHP